MHRVVATSVASVVLACCIVGGGGQSFDSTPPTISVTHTQPYVFHVLVIVQIDETGNIWCGAVLAGNSVPDSGEIRGNSGPMQGTVATASVAGSTPTAMSITGLTANTAYDIYCYAEDIWSNQVPPTDIAATLRSVTTLAGADITKPTLSYVSPTSIVEPRTVKLFVKLNEEGTVWCVLLRDIGLGTTAPSKGDIINNINVDGWATAPITAAGLYQAQLFFGSLEGATTYDAYCFATDIAGNGIDDTPANAEDTSAIPSTKISGLTTPSFQASFFEVHPPSIAPSHYALEPAVWNNYLPRHIISGDQERRDLESWNAPLAVIGSLVNLVGEATRGCDTLPVAARGFIWLAVVRRGGCTFRQKAKRAHLAGYSALIVVDFLTGTLPDMYAADADDPIEIPAWIISPADGDTLVAIMNSALEPFPATITDLKRKPLLGVNQCDNFGCRTYITE